jgi:hypothetical protein
MAIDTEPFPLQSDYDPGQHFTLDDTQYESNDINYSYPAQLLPAFIVLEEHIELEDETASSGESERDGVEVEWDQAAELDEELTENRRESSQETSASNELQDALDALGLEMAGLEMQRT